MKGMGDGDARGAFDGAFDEATRVGPIPLTVKRSSPNTPVEFDLPVVASVDVDLRTPAPLPFPITIATSNKPAPHERLSPTGAFAMQPRPPSPQRPYIRPTPTFSFTDEPPPNAAWQQPQRRGRSGSGLFAIGVLMAVAGVGGYMAVKYRAWQELEPLVERAKDLGQSFRTLAPSASPERPTRTATPSPNVAPAAPALRPTVVPIEPERPTTTASTTATSAPARTKRRSSTQQSTKQSSKQSSARSRRPTPALSAEAAAEEALLAAPSRGR